MTAKIKGKEIGLLRKAELLTAPTWEPLPTDEPVEAGVPWLDGTVISI